MHYQNIECDSAFMVGLFGMLSFVGMCLGNLWTPKTLDKFGRRRALLVSQLIQLLCKIGVVLLPNFKDWSVNMYYVLIFINGSMQICKTTGCYNLMCEVAPMSTHTAMGTLWNMSEGTIFIILTIYFRFISKEWRWSVAIGIVECLIGYTLLVFVVPESPKW